MTIFWKSLILALAPDPSLQTEIPIDMFHIYCCSTCMQNLITIALVIAKLKYLTFDPLGEVKGGGVKLWHCHAYLQALSNHGL